MKRKLLASLISAALVTAPVAHAQQAKPVDTRNFAGRFFDNFGLVAVCFAPAQIHAQQHRRPVLRLSAAGAGLNVKKRTVRVHLAGKHAAKFHRCQLLFVAFQIFCDGIGCVRVLLISRKLQQVARVGQTIGERRKGIDDLFELRAFAA